MKNYRIGYETPRFNILNIGTFEVKATLEKGKGAQENLGVLSFSVGSQMWGLYKT